MSTRFSPALVALVVGAMLALAPGIASGSDASIGLYTDAIGSSCSFSGNQSGVVTAYVVVRPGDSPIQGVQFSAPIPSCFDASLLAEYAPPPFLAAGNSQTGISIMSPGCETAPFNALQILYMNNGNTTACCAFGVSVVGATDCSASPVAMMAVTSHFNADPSCDCSGVLPPAPPSLPQPPDGSTMRDINEPLIWYSTDPSGRPMTADVYLGTNPDPTLVANNVPVEPYTTFWPQQFFLYGTTYYWKVVLRNSGGAEAVGPAWSFTTRPNHPPTITNPTPPNGGTKLPVPSPFVLTWAADDPDGHALRYDVHFGESPSPPKVASDVFNRSFAVEDVQFTTTYWWYVVARDSYGLETTGPTWSFTTKAFNEPPEVPHNPAPASNATN
ncbi:MAG TPA: hypothetical protein VF247_04050, partial [Candidatus Krumholzibacteria bacterium]